MKFNYNNQKVLCLHQQAQKLDPKFKFLSHLEDWLQQMPAGSQVLIDQHVFHNFGLKLM